MRILFALFVLFLSSATFAQTPPLEPGVSQELARWRAARYSDVRYKLNLTLEKMSPVLKGSIEIRLNVHQLPRGTQFSGGLKVGEPGFEPMPAIILDWRKIKGHEGKSTISNVSINGTAAEYLEMNSNLLEAPRNPTYTEHAEHLIFRNSVAGENVIKLEFTSPILPSGSAITRYVDKEDGSEYIYSLFVPSDASTAFPVFDQPDLKARFTLNIESPITWRAVSNTNYLAGPPADLYKDKGRKSSFRFFETSPISTYVFAFAAGDFDEFVNGYDEPIRKLPLNKWPNTQVNDALDPKKPRIYVRKSQAAKFKPHADEVFRLNREAVRYFEQYFDYKFPFPKYDLVLIPEFPFGGMEHAGATFLREASIIFPQEPTKNDIVTRATLIFHEAAHQWFGDTVTMRWFDDLWLKEGFATFTAYKAMERIMPEMNAWKVFYERIKQGAYQTDSTRGTTAIYQPIANLSAAKSAYGNIVYNKAPAFLRQAEFYLGEDKFQTAVRAFLKKHEFGNASWQDLVSEFEEVYWNDFLYSESGKRFLANKDERLKHEKLSREYIRAWAQVWVNQRGLPMIRVEHCFIPTRNSETTAADTQCTTFQERKLGGDRDWEQKYKVLIQKNDGGRKERLVFPPVELFNLEAATQPLIFLNYRDYGYGIFLLDGKSREYVLKNIQNEKDPFLRTMMWGSLWDSVREGELDPRVFVELVVKVLGSSSRAVTTPSAQRGGHPSLDKEGRKEMQKPDREGGLNAQRADHALANARASATEGEDESTVATLLGRTGTALNYYIDDRSEPPALAGGFRPQAEGSSTRVRPGGVPDTNGGRTTDAGVKNPSAHASGSDLRGRVEDLLIERMRNAPSLGQRITYYRAFLNIGASERARGEMKRLLRQSVPGAVATGSAAAKNPVATAPGTDSGGAIPLKTKDRFDIVTRLLILGDAEAPRLLAELEKTETSDDAKRYAYAARAGIGTAENKAKYWNDFVSNKEISESWIEAAFGPWNSIRHAELTLPYLERALKELPNHKRNRKIFFVNGWLGAFIGGQRSAEALGVVNKFLADNPALDNDLRLKILENVDLIERAVNIRRKFPHG